MIIYVDVLFIVNLIITYFLLITSALLTGYTYSRKRIVYAAVIGAVSCFYIFVRSKKVIVDLSVKVVSAVICSAVAFGLKNRKKFIVQMVCFVLLNMLLTGLIIVISVRSTAIYHENLFFYIDINPVLLVILSLIVYIVILLFSLVKEEISAQSLYSIDIISDDFILENIPAFYDSGCKVKDIVSNRDIIIISFEKICDKLPKDLKKDINCFYKEDFENVKRCFVPVFFNTVSGGGMIPALKIKNIKCAEKTIYDVLVAFVKSDLSENVTAIFGTNIKRQL